MLIAVFIGWTIRGKRREFSLATVPRPDWLPLTWFASDYRSDIEEHDRLAAQQNARA